MTIFRSLGLSAVVAINILFCGINSVQIQAQGGLIQTPAQPTLRIEPYSHERDYQDLYQLFIDNCANLGAWRYDETFPQYNQIKVARFNDRFAGFVIYNKADQSGYINYVAVDESIRNAGLGKLLLQDAINDLKGQGAESVSLNVFAHNAKAQSLYERLGFNVQSMNYTLNIA